jgi:hypothetical protein
MGPGFRSWTAWPATPARRGSPRRDDGRKPCPVVAVLLAFAKKRREPGVGSRGARLGTLPRRALAIAPWPREPTTIRSASMVSAKATISSAGSPLSNLVLTSTRFSADRARRTHAGASARSSRSRLTAWHRHIGARPDAVSGPRTNHCGMKENLKGGIMKRILIATDGFGPGPRGARVRA